MRKAVPMQCAAALVLVAGLSLAGCSGEVPSFLASAAPPQQDVQKADEAATVPDSSTTLVQAKAAFQRQEFGLAETHYRQAVEEVPGNVEAWLGLAATHDEIGRFDLADRDYAKILKLGKVTAEFLNNRGYSYLLRGDYARARTDFFAARKLAPDNAFVAANIVLLEERSSGKT